MLKGWLMKQLKDTYSIVGSTELKTLSSNCAFCNNCFPSILRDRIVSGINDDVVRKYLLAEDKLTLDKAIDICRSYEVADQGMETLRTETTINRIHMSKRNEINENSRSSNGEAKNEENSRWSKCKFCLLKHKWGRKFCHAWGKQCNVCGKENHLKGSIVCSGQVDSVRDVTREHNLFLGAMTEDVRKVKAFDVDVEYKGKRLKFKIDTGADVSVIGVEHLKIFTKELGDLIPTVKNFRGANSTQIKCLGYMSLMVKINKRVVPLTAYVCEGARIPLLGRPEIIHSNLVDVKIDGVETDREVRKSPRMSYLPLRKD